MFFQNFRAFKILDAFRVKRDGRGGVSEPRDWAALAFRISGASKFHSNGEVFSADTGSVIYIPSGVGFTRVGRDEELIILHLQTALGEGDKIEVAYPENPAATAEAFSMIHDEWKYKKSGFEYRAAAILYNLLAHLSSAEDKSVTGGKHSLIEAGAEAISLNFSDPELTVARLAEECNISEEYFRRLYKAKYGISPHAAILEKRIEKAKSLLESGYFEVSLVCEESGFSNVKHFSTAFRKRVGKTPSEYKKQFNTLR